MADRHNLCINPALSVNVTGWGGGSTPTRTAVTGFDRSWAARYTSGTFLSTAATNLGAITVGLTYTLSVYLRPASFSGSGAIYIEWINAGGSGFGYPNTSYTITSGTVTRASITAVAPTNAVGARIILDGVNYAVNSCDITMVLIEQAGSAGDYFDGDTPGGSWDGAAGNSASTLSDAPTEQTIAIAQATETDTGRALTATKATALGRAAEAGTARPLAVSKSFAPNRSAEADTGRALTLTKTIALGRAVEADTGRVLTTSTTVTLTPARAVEADTGRPLAITKAIAIGRAVETSTARRLTVAGGAEVDDDITIRVISTRRGWSARTSPRPWSARTSRH